MTPQPEVERFRPLSVEDGDDAPADAPTVLIVDDNEDVRECLTSHLFGRYNVLEARDGAEGLEMARDKKPDLLLADVMMPEMDGYELCKTIKSDESIAHIPVVPLTARASEEAEIEGLEVGADDNVYKPFNAEALLARVENLIENSDDAARARRPARGARSRERVRNRVSGRFQRREILLEAISQYVWCQSVGLRGGQNAGGGPGVFEQSEATKRKHYEGRQEGGMSAEASSNIPLPDSACPPRQISAQPVRAS